MPRGLSTISSNSCSFVFADALVGAEVVVTAGDLKPALLPIPLSIFAFASEAFVGRVAPSLLPAMTLAHKRLICLAFACADWGLVVFAIRSVEMELAGEEIDCYL